MANLSKQRSRLFKIYRHCCCTFTTPGYVTRHWPIIIDLGMKLSCRHDWSTPRNSSFSIPGKISCSKRKNTIYLRALTNASKQNKISYSFNFFIRRAILFFFFLSFKHYLQEKKIIDDRLEIRDNFNRYKNYFDIYILSSRLFDDAKKFAISFLKLYSDISVFLLFIHRYNLFIYEK